MRILIATDTYYPHVNGASYFAQRLARHLQNRGHAVAVVAPSTSFKNAKSVVNGILVYGIWSLPVFFYKKFRFSPPPIFIKFHIRGIIEEFNPDVVHLQGHFFVSRTVLNAARVKRIPVIATNHFMPENLAHYLHLPAVVADFIKDLAWRDFAGIFNRADYITTPTETAAGLIRKRLQSSVKAISCGIDLERFNPRNKGEYLIQRYQIPRKPVLLYVGRLDQEKNLDLVLRAIAKIVSKIGFHFVIAGTGADSGRLKNLAEELFIGGAVTFTGFIPDEDLPNLYALADCFIIAGTAELQSIVTMEAMASGLPVIAVNAVALSELVRDGENGFLFENQDTEMLAEKITAIFSDQGLRKRMGEKSLEFIAAHDINKTISALEKIYQSEYDRVFKKI